MTTPAHPSGDGVATVGLIANPNAGKDVRRLVSAASPTSDMAKVGILRRAIIGAVEGGACRVLLANDRHALGERATRDLELSADIVLLDEPVHDSGRNSTVAACRFRDMGCDAVIVLGGDGTHRDVVLGWREVPLVAISTGTNNVFPRAIEATLAGHAAGLVASGAVALADVAHQAKVLELTTTDRPGDHDLALVDIALIDTGFTGSRAVWEPATIREIVAAIAEPASVGLSAIAAAARPVGRNNAGATHVVLGLGRRVRAPIAPGLYADVEIATSEWVPTNASVTIATPGALALDGERDRMLPRSAEATITVRANGPYVIDINTTMAVANAATQLDSPIEKAATDGY